MSIQQRITMPDNLINYDLANHYRRELKQAKQQALREQARKDARLISVRVLNAVLLTVAAVHVAAWL